MNIHITNFVRRQTPESQHSHWIISDNELINRCNDGFKNAKPGYRDGVLLIPVNPDGFFCSVVTLKAGDKLYGEFSPRQQGEAPRSQIYTIAPKSPAKSVMVVVYSHTVLSEKNENETDADYEIVSINASPTDEETPIPVGTLIANHLGMSGGTDTKMTDSDFVSLLRKSMEFWKDRSLCRQEQNDYKM